MSPFGVVIPPNPGDENYEPPDWTRFDPDEIGARNAQREREAIRRQNAPQEPHAPISAPDGTRDVSAGGEDDSEALRARLADAALHARVPHAPAWADLDEFIRETWLHSVRDIVEEVLAYGREQRTRGAEQALREAATFCRTREDSARERRGDYNDGLANAYDAVADELEARADDLGRQS